MKIITHHGPFINYCIIFLLVSTSLFYDTIIGLIMEDPLLQIRRISNPQALSLFEKDGKRILILGDVHIQQKTECKSCTVPTCVNYITLLEQLDKYHKEQGTDLDVYVESFSPEDPKSTWNRIKRTTYNISTPLFQKILYYNQLDLYGVRKALVQKLFFHKAEDHIRYHYIDLRLTSKFKELGIDVLKLIVGFKTIEEVNDYLAQFKIKYPTKKDFTTKAKEFCFRPYSPKRFPSRIAKQTSKLSSTEKKLLERFFDLKITELNKSSYDIHYIFDVAVLMMDIYGLARFMRFFEKQPTNSTSVFIAGALHSFNYTDFMKLWKAKQLENIGFTGKRGYIFLNRITKRRKCIRVNFTKKLRRHHT